LDGGNRSRRCKPGLFADKDRTVLSATLVDGGQQSNISSNNGTKTMAKLSYKKQVRVPFWLNDISFREWITF